MSRVSTSWRRSRARRCALGVALSAVLAAGASHGQPASRDPQWLARLNEWRAVAGLPAVTEGEQLSTGAERHARYCLENGVSTHVEARDNRWWSAEGDAAARRANVLVYSSAGVNDAWPFDVWVTGPFHALRLLDPRADRVGFGVARDAGARTWVELAAVYDSVRGRRPTARVGHPVRFPAPGAVVPLPAHCGGTACFAGDERPDPLASCPGLAPPTGLPILLLLDALTPALVDATSLSADGASIAHCAFTAATYTNRVPAEQARGRRVLAEFNAVVVIPRDPLGAGRRYDVTVDANGTRHAWRFDVADR